MNVGDYRVDFPLDGYFRLDGGAMFGVIPRPLWSPVAEPDDRNRIRLAARPMLLRNGDYTVLVDTGIGGRWNEKERNIYDIQRDGHGIVSSLRDLGVEPEEVTDVFLTHLHFDHAGATTYRDDRDRLRLRFPEATHHLQRAHWSWASAPTERDAGSFRPEDFSLLDTNDQLNLVEGRTCVFPGVEGIRVDGHTRGLQMVRVKGDPDLYYVTDLIPTAAHLPLPYVMGYDLWPLETLEQKKSLYENITFGETLLAFEHDPDRVVCTVQKGEKHHEVHDVLTGA